MLDYSFTAAPEPTGRAIRQMQPPEQHTAHAERLRNDANGEAKYNDDFRHTSALKVGSVCEFVSYEYEMEKDNQTVSSSRQVDPSM